MFKRIANLLDNYFKITARGSTIRREARGALVLFGACSYILMVNPKVLSLAGINEEKALLDTAITGSLWTVVVGLLVNLPLVVAPGMGLNVFFACEMIRSQGMSYNNACGVCLVSFILVLVLVASGVAVKFICWMPSCLKQAVIIGIGLLQSFLGLYSLGIIDAGETTPLKFKSFWEPDQLIAMVTLIVTTILMSKHVDGAILYGMGIGITLWYLLVGHETDGVRSRLPYPPQTYTGIEFHLSPRDIYTALAIFAISVADIGGILISFSSQCPDMVDPKTGLFRDTNKILLWVSVSGIFAALIGASPPIIFMESIVGIASGAKTGLASSICGIMIGACIFLKFALTFIPSCIGFSVLILVGSLMMESATGGIKWNNIREAFPAWMTIMGIAYTCSICTGLGFGLGFYLAINVPFWTKSGAIGDENDSSIESNEHIDKSRGDVYIQI